MLSNLLAPIKLEGVLIHTHAHTYSCMYTHVCTHTCIQFSFQPVIFVAWGGCSDLEGMLCPRPLLHAQCPSPQNTSSVREPPVVPQGAVRRVSYHSSQSQVVRVLGLKIHFTLQGHPVEMEGPPGLPSHPPLLAPGWGSSSRESQMPEGARALQKEEALTL